MKKSSITFTGVILYLLLTTGYSQWQQLGGPWAGRADDIAVGILDQQELIYVADEEYLPYRFKEGDNQWTPLEHADSWYPYCIATVQDGANEVFIGMPHVIPYQGDPLGIYWSQNLGIDWDDRNGIGDNIIRNKEISTISTDSNNPNRIFAGCFYDFDTGDMLYRTLDKGLNWTKLTISESPAWAISSINFHPQDANVIFATVGLRFLTAELEDRIEEHPEVTPDALGVYRSSNGGETWTFVLQLPNNLVISNVAIDPVDPQIVYVGFESSIYKSEVGGDEGTWTLLENSPDYVTNIAIDPTNHAIIYAASQNGFFKSEDYGLTWVEKDYGMLDKKIVSFKMSLQNPSTLYAGTLSSFYISNDGGDSWEEFMLGMKLDKVVSIANVGIDTILTASTDACLRSTINRGTTWKTLRPNANLSHIFDVEQSSFYHNTMYAATENILLMGILWRSIDGGESWEQIHGTTGLYGNATLSVNLSNCEPNTVYFVHPYYLEEMETYQFNKSLDSGNSWRGTNITSHPNVWTFTSDPDNSQVLYIGINDFGGFGGEFGVYHTYDGGNTWQPMEYGLDPGVNIFDLCVVPTNTNILYAGTNIGMYRSDDGGLNWHHLNSSPTDNIISVVANPYIPNIIYACTSTDVYQSIDGGMSWFTINEGILGNYIRELRVTPSIPTILYAATGNGLYYYQDSHSSEITSFARLYGDISILDDIIVGPSGTLEITPGTRVSFEPSTQMIVQGIIVAEGTSNDHITITSSSTLPSPGDWAGITISNSIGSNLYYCDISFAETAIHLFISSANIDNCTIINNKKGMLLEQCRQFALVDNIIRTNEYYGLYLLVSSDGTLERNQIFHNGTYATPEAQVKGGIILHASSPTLRNNTINFNLPHGLIAMNGSQPVLNQGGAGRNHIEANGEPFQLPWPGTPANAELRLFDNSFPALARGHNDIFDVEGGYLIYADQPQPRPKDISYNYWNDDDNNHLSERFYPVGLFRYQPYDEQPNTDGQSGDGWNSSQTAFQQGLSQEQSGDWTAAFETYQTLISTFPDSIEAVESLPRLFICTAKSTGDFQVLQGYFNGLTQAYSGTDLAKQASQYSILCHFPPQEYGQAIQKYEFILSDPPSLQDSVYAIINIGQAYFAAETASGGLTRQAPLGIMPEYRPATREEYYQKVNELMGVLFDSHHQSLYGTKIPTDYALIQNFPNPFNPATTLQYHLPFISDVNLVIYNVLGQTIWHRHLQNQTVGTHKFTWSGLSDNGKSLPSGVYILQFVAKDSDQNMRFSDTTKLLLLH